MGDWKSQGNGRFQKVDYRFDLIKRKLLGLCWLRQNVWNRSQFPSRILHLPVITRTWDDGEWKKCGSTELLVRRHDTLYGSVGRSVGLSVRFSPPLKFGSNLTCSPLQNPVHKCGHVRAKGQRDLTFTKVNCKLDDSWRWWRVSKSPRLGTLFGWLETCNLLDINQIWIMVFLVHCDCLGISMSMLFKWWFLIFFLLQFQVVFVRKSDSCTLSLIY